jgi:YD repeat-containing protein
MKKISLLAVFIFWGFIGFGQDSSTSISHDFPTIISPSPTVSGLMKFEEIPVSNYTGIPDISIPLYSCGTLSKDINFNVSLKYHPASIAVDEVASDVGLGWSLIAGGTISRTVRGNPDESNINHGKENDKIGMYQLNLTEKFEDFAQLNGSNFNALNDVDKERYRESVWDYHYRPRYDNQYDLWQFNFFGKSGRFYIKKNTTNSLLEVQPLDDYRLKIVNHYTQSTLNNVPKYTPVGFDVYDEKGYKYVFDVVEQTKQISAIKNFRGNPVNNYSSGQPETYDLPTVTFNDTEFYNSSFHLSKVYNNNGLLLISFNFNEVEQKEVRKTYSNTSNKARSNQAVSFGVYFDPCIAYQNLINSNAYPRFSETSTLTISKVKKIKEITVTNISTILFNYEMGREDDNVYFGEETPIFKGLIVKMNNSIVKKYTFEHVYTTLIEDSKRLLLSQLNDVSNGTVNTLSHTFEYEENNYDGCIVDKDYWGYFTIFPEKSMNRQKKAREPNARFSTTDVLQKITYPTGGCTLFDFESNQYSYISNELQTNFDANPDNWHEVVYTQPSQEQPFVFTDNTIKLLPVSNVKRRAQFRPSITDIASTYNDTINYKNFTLYKIINGVPTDGVGLSCPNYLEGCIIDFELEPNIQYGVRRNLFMINMTSSDTLRIRYYERNLAIKEFLYGGGNRIKRIGYFTEDVPKDYYKNTSYSPVPFKAKEKVFHYQFFDNQNRSSGALVFGMPIYSYGRGQEYCTQIGRFERYVETTTSNNNLPFIRTQGSDVGYKNVRVYENNLGRSEYLYTTSIEFPEEENLNGFLPPFLPSENYDYKRGLLLKEKHYSENRLLNSIDYDYDYIDMRALTGVKVYDPNTLVKVLNLIFIYYSSYKNYLEYSEQLWNNQEIIGYQCINCTFEHMVIPNPESGHPSYLPNPNFVPIYDPFRPIYSTIVDFLCLPNAFFCHYDEINTMLNVKLLYEAYGWAKLKQKTTTNYFYEGGNTHIVEQTEDFTYNPENKQIATHKTSNSLHDSIETRYFYHSGDSPFSQNRISEIERIETYKNNSLQSTSTIGYSNNWHVNQSFLPQTVSVAKEGQNPEVRLHYMLYDEYGHPLQVLKENGMVVCYIWGYNNSQPIAKIENASYASIDTNLILAAQNESNTNNEQSLIQKLNNIRASLPNAMVTTYTYKPLVGISTVTDPKGLLQRYEYDDFGRLKMVFDHLGNKLSEHEYHYRP